MFSTDCWRMISLEARYNAQGKFKVFTEESQLCVTNAAAHPTKSCQVLLLDSRWIKNGKCRPMSRVVFILDDGQPTAFGEKYYF